MWYNSDGIVSDLEILQLWDLWWNLPTLRPLPRFVKYFIRLAYIIDIIQILMLYKPWAKMRQNPDVVKDPFWVGSPIRAVSPKFKEWQSLVVVFRRHIGKVTGAHNL